MRTFSIYRRLLASIFVVALFSVYVEADDADVSIVGPSGVSSIAIADVYDHFRSDEIWNASGQKVGATDSTGNYVTLSGIYAVNNRVSITAALPARVGGDRTSTWFDTSQSRNYDGVGGDLSIGAVLWDKRRDSAFRVNGYVGVNKSAESNPTYFATLQPQYYFADNLLLSMNLGEQHTASYVTSRYASANLYWRIDSRWSLVPSIGFTAYPAHNHFTSYDVHSYSLTTTYHIDRRWAVSAGVGRALNGDQISDYWANSVINAREWSGNLTVRRIL